MSSEKTEEATPRRRQKAREEGQVSKSQDLNSSLVLASNLMILAFCIPMIAKEMYSVVKYTLGHLSPDNIDDSIISILVPYFQSMGLMLLPFLLMSTAVTVLILRILIGPLFSLKALGPKWDKLLPSKTLNILKEKFNPFSPKQMVELAKSFIKLLVVGSVGYSVAMARMPEMLGLLGLPVAASFATISDVVTQMIIMMCIAMIFLGLIDKKYQDYEYNKSIKMSKQEVQDERKNQEGDPQIKSKIKAAQMQFQRQKMMQNLKTADVVVTNPTHYAVAIRYDIEKAPAPQVVAKGVDFLAFKIRDIAKENGIPIQENKPLARTLYKMVPVEGLIPPELYVAVAELLAFVYNKNKGR